MNTRNLDQARAAAAEIVKRAVPLPEAQKFPTVEATKQANNRLRFELYIKEADSSHTNLSVTTYISRHTATTQIFLNALGAGIDEDGIRGNDTKNAIRKYLGIDIDSGTIVAGVTLAGKEQTGKNEEVVYDLPDFMQDEEQIRGMLKQLGIKGLSIKNGKLIGRMNLDTQDKLRKLEQYLDYVNYLEQQDESKITPEGKVKRYKELLKDSTKFIWDKQYLIQMYISSIYQDLTDVGCTIRQDGVNGEYVIAGMRSDPKIHRLTNEYNEVVSGGAVRTAYIEFARVYGMVESSNNPRFHEQDVSREGLVLHILQNNSLITGENGLKPKIQDIKGLLIHKESVVAQLSTMLAGLSTASDDPNFHHYQEVIWLHDFLKHENYKQKDIQKDIFNQVNSYKNVFIKEQSFIDALKAEGVDPDNIDPKDSTTMGKLEKILGKNSPALYMLGIVMLIFSDTRKLGIGLILGTMAAKAGVSIASDTAKEVGDAGNTVGDTFDMFDPAELRHNINYPEGLNRDDYDPTLTALYNANDTRRNSGEVVDSTAVKHTDNAKIAFIFQEIMKNEDLLTAEFASADTTASANSIYDKLSSKNITETSFDSIVPAEQRGKVELNDVKVFVELLRGQGENEDKTIMDYITPDLDILNQVYAPKAFTGKESFDADLNYILEIQYTGADTRQGRLDILAVQNKLYETLNGTFSNQVNPQFGWIDSSIAYLRKAGIGTANVAIEGLEGSKKYFNLSAGIKSQIPIIQSYLEQELPGSASAIVSLLNDYQTVFEAQGENEKYQGLWDGNATSIQNHLASILGLGGVAFDAASSGSNAMKVSLSQDISQEMTKLKAILEKIDGIGGTDELKNSINANINRLSTLQLNIAEEIGTQNDIIAGWDAVAMFAAENGDTARLETEMRGSHAILQGFIDGNITNATSLERITAAFSKMSRFNTALSGETVSLDDPARAVLQRNILSYNTSFESQQEAILDRIQHVMNQRFATYDTQQEKIDSINNTNPALSLTEKITKLGEVEGWFEHTLNYGERTLAAETRAQAGVIGQSWGALQALSSGAADLGNTALAGIYTGGEYALDTGGFLVDVAQSGLATAAYATWTLPYFQSLGNKFSQVLAEERSRPVEEQNSEIIEQSQRIIDATERSETMLTRLKNMDDENTKFLKNAKAILESAEEPENPGESATTNPLTTLVENLQNYMNSYFNAGTDQKTLQELYKDYSLVRSELRAAVLGRITEQSTATELGEISRLYAGDTEVMEKLEEMRELLVKNRPILSFTDIETRLQNDLTAVNLRIAAITTTTTEKTGLQKLAEIIKVITTGVGTIKVANVSYDRNLTTVKIFLDAAKEIASSYNIDILAGGYLNNTIGLITE